MSELISDEDKLVVESLLENNDEEAHFDFGYPIAKQIVGLLLCDKYFLVQSLSLINPKYFEDSGHKLICNIVFDFYKEYKELPNKQVVLHEIAKKSKNELQIQYTAEYESIVNDFKHKHANRDYLQKLIIEFAKVQAVKSAVSETIDIVKKDKNGYGKIWNLWRNALTTDKSHDMGLDYFSELDERYMRMLDIEQNAKDKFTSGFIGIDNYLTSKGLTRGEIGCFVGASGSGKSIGLINAAARNIQRGHKVLYITLEMSQDKIAQRFDSLFTSKPFKLLKEEPDIVKNAIRDVVKFEEDHRKLIIKHYPGGSADINTFRAYVSQLSLYGFKPDLVCVDYIGELKDIPGIKTYESRQLLVRELRAFASEENVCGLTAIQSNKEGKQAQSLGGNIDLDHLSDSFGQARPFDAMWSINRPDPSCTAFNLYIMKHRDGISNQQICCELITDTLEMLEITREAYNVKLAQNKKKKADLLELNPIEIK